jgi:hypothetical protein
VAGPEDRGSVRRPVNWMQGLMIGFFGIAWVALVVMVSVSPGVREVVVGRMPGSGTPVVIGFLVGLGCFLGLLTFGVLRRWRWLFWALVAAFAAGAARVPVAWLQLTGRMTPEGPSWYVVTQGGIGVVQVVIAVLLLVGWRRTGVWGVR